jgi:hypothetical protein
MERFSLKKLNEIEGKEHIHVKILNMFAVENLDAEADVTRALKALRDNIKISAKESLSYYELKMHDPWFDEGCSELLDQRKQAKLQWLQDQGEINGYNLNNKRCECGRHFREKERISEG